MVGHHWCKATFFSKLAGSSYENYYSHVGQVKRKVNCGELSAEKTLLGLPDIVKAACQIHALKLIQEPCCEIDLMPNVSFTLSSNNKDQLRDV